MSEDVTLAQLLGPARDWLATRWQPEAEMTLRVLELLSEKHEVFKSADAVHIYREKRSPIMHYLPGGIHTDNSACWLVNLVHHRTRLTRETRLVTCKKCLSSPKWVAASRRAAKARANR